MSDVRLTEERLRTWVTSQDEQERMCLGVLALDGRFSDVKPRRPKGGPDQGRDIEAVLDGRRVVWGAVGFRKNATDSNTDKQVIKKKFKDDLHAAKNKNPALDGFVFFTNVDLTPAEVLELERHSRSEGFSFTEIFYRERLRIKLDSPRGLSLRYQYLDIPLSEAEQKAFFAEYGAEIEGILHKGFGAVEERLRRIEFLHDCAKPLMGASVVLTLKEECKVEDLGHFRFIVEILNLYEPEPHPGLWIAGRDAYSEFISEGRSRKLLGVKSLAWSQYPDEKIQNTVICIDGGSTKQLEAFGHLHKRGPYRTLGDLEKRDMSVYLTKPLFDLVRGIYVTANEYIIQGASDEYFVPMDMAPLVKWPETLSDEEMGVPWVTVALKITDPPDWMPTDLARTGWSLDFSRYTPEKIESSQV